MASTRAYLSPPPAVAPFIPSGVFYDTPSVPRGADLDDEEYSDEDEECELFDPSDRFFPVSHDLFLVQQCCFHPESRMADVVTRFEREFEVSRTAQELEERLKRLESPDFRALFVLYLKAVALDKDAQLGGHVTLGALAKYQPLLDSARTSCETRLFQLLYEDEKFKQDACESVTIEVTGRSFPKYSRVVSKAELRRCCRAIDDLYRSAGGGGEVVVSLHQSCSLHAVDTQREHLSLTDTAAFYDSCNGFNHMEQPIIDRLVLFAKDPNIMERLTLQKQQQKEAARIKRASNQELRSIFDKQRQRQAERLEQLRSDSLEQTRAQLEKAMEDDIEHIRRMHAQLLKHEEAKIHAKYDELQAALQGRVKTMQREVLALQKSCESSGWHGLEQGIMGTSLHIEKIFGTSDFLLRLLILAEDLEARPLRQALIRYLSDKNRLPQFALRREMTSKLIADSTVLAILKGTSTQDLREVEGYGKNFLHHDLVARELHTRKIELGRFLAGLTNDQLRSARRLQLPKGHHTVATDGNDSEAEDAEDNNPRETLDADVERFEQFVSFIADFPESLDQEFARRRDFSCVKMSSVGIERDVNFSEEDCVLQLETPHRYCTVPATKERKQGESGKWMFEVTVEVFGGDGESLLIGWEIPRDERDVSSDAGPLVLASSSPSRASFSHTATAPSTLVPGLSPGADGRSFGVTWQSDGGLEMGMLHANGQSRSGVPCFRAGDVVGCTIDQDHAVPHLRFYLNGDLALPMRADNSSRSSSSSSSSSSNSHGHIGSIAVLNPAYCLSPVVSMYSSKRKPQTRVRFNFRGGFRFPVAGFDPFGAPLD